MADVEMTPAERAAHSIRNAMQILDGIQRCNVLQPAKMDASDARRLLVTALTDLTEAQGDVETLRSMVDDLNDDVRELRASHVRDARYIERLERANSTLHRSFEEEQREREALVTACGNALGEMSEYFRQANQLRGRGTPRAITREDAGLPTPATVGNGARVHSPTAPASASVTHEPPRIAATGA